MIEEKLRSWLDDNTVIDEFKNTVFLNKKVLVYPYIEDKSTSAGLAHLTTPDGKSLGEQVYELHNIWKVIAVGHSADTPISVGDIVSLDDNMLIPPMIDAKHPVGNNPDNPHRVVYGNPLDRLFPFRFNEDKLGKMTTAGERTKYMLHFLPLELITVIWDKNEIF